MTKEDMEIIQLLRSQIALLRDAVKDLADVSKTHHKALGILMAEIKDPEVQKKLMKEIELG